MTKDGAMTETGEPISDELHQRRQEWNAAAFPAVPGPAQNALRAALERVLLDIDFMVERGVIPDIRDDIIYQEARSALSSTNRGEGE